MNSNTLKQMQQTPPLFDWDTLIKVFGPVFGFISGFTIWVNAHFKDKEKERKAKEQERVEFIEKIAETTVNKTLDKVFGDINKNIDVLFKYRETDRKHWDDRFDAIMREIKK